MFEDIFKGGAVVYRVLQIRRGESHDLSGYGARLPIAVLHLFGHYENMVYSPKTHNHTECHQFSNHPAP